MLFDVSPKLSTLSSAWPGSSSRALDSAIRHSRRSPRLTKKSLTGGMLPRLASRRWRGLVSERMAQLDDTRVLVTGGTSGLGRAMAHALTRAGAQVVITSRDGERARAAAA